jgi:GINS complex protein
MDQSNAEFSSFYAAFRADDTLMEILPALDYQPPLSSHSTLFLSTLPSTSFGPFKAGIASTVPLWMAVVLQQRSFATIILPSWLSISNLTSILQFEKRNVSLFHTTIAAESTGSRLSTENARKGDDDSEADSTINESNVDFDANKEELFLPTNYYEVAVRLLSSSSNSRSSAASMEGSTENNNFSVLSLLVQDIYEIRIDKLRQQFQTLLSDTTTRLMSTPSGSSNATDLIINVTGIGTQELASIQPFVIRAMSDTYYLASSSQQSSTHLTTSSLYDGLKNSSSSEIVDDPTLELKEQPPLFMRRPRSSLLKRRLG